MTPITISELKAKHPEARPFQMADHDGWHVGLNGKFYQAPTELGVLQRLSDAMGWRYTIVSDETKAVFTEVFTEGWRHPVEEAPMKSLPQEMEEVRQIHGESRRTVTVLELLKERPEVYTNKVDAGVKQYRAHTKHTGVYFGDSYCEVLQRLSDDEGWNVTVVEDKTPGSDIEYFGQPTVRAQQEELRNALQERFGPNASPTPRTDEVSKQIVAISYKWKLGEINMTEFIKLAQAELNKLGTLERELTAAPKRIKELEK